MKKSMPVGSFRRPELQATVIVEDSLKFLPKKYIHLLPVQDPFTVYMMVCIVTTQNRGVDPHYAKSVLQKEPFYFAFGRVSTKYLNLWKLACEEFNIGQLKNYFYSTNQALPRGYTNQRLEAGLDNLAIICSQKNQITEVFQDMQSEVNQIRESRKTEGDFFISKWNLQIASQEAFYLFKKPDARELANYFFINPSYFVSDSPCSRCGNNLTNWISVAYGKGPICGDHDYRISYVSKNIEEVCSYVEALIENKHQKLSEVDLAPGSPLVKFRNSKISEFAFGDDFWDQNPFESKSILKCLVDSEYGASWKDEIGYRVRTAFD